MEVYYINFDLSLAYMDQISPSFDSIKNMHGKMMKLNNEIFIYVHVLIYVL